MEDKKPCDDIFDGLAELLINNGRIMHNVYTRKRACEHGVFVVHTAETWDITYGGYTYIVVAHDGDFDSIQRFGVVDDVESEGI